MTNTVPFPDITLAQHRCAAGLGSTAKVRHRIFIRQLFELLPGAISNTAIVKLLNTECQSRPECRNVFCLFRLISIKFNKLGIQLAFDKVRSCSNCWVMVLSSIIETSFRCYLYTSTY